MTACICRENCAQGSVFFFSPDSFNFRTRGPLLLPTCSFGKAASIVPNSLLSFLILSGRWMTLSDRWMASWDRRMTLFSHVFPASTSRSYLWNLFNLLGRVEYWFLFLFLYLKPELSKWIDYLSIARFFKNTTNNENLWKQFIDWWCCFRMASNTGTGGFFVTY